MNIRSLYGKSKILTYTKSDWRSKKKFAGGGILTDQGIHMLDLLKFFCGEFKEFKSFVSNKFWKFDIEDDVFAIMRNKKLPPQYILQHCNGSINLKWKFLLKRVL